AAMDLAGANDYDTIGQESGVGKVDFAMETWFKGEGTGVSTSTGTGGVDALPRVTKRRAQSEGSNVDMNYFLGIRPSPPAGCTTNCGSNVLVADFEEGAGQPSPGLNHPVVGATAVTSNVWHHAAATYDGSTWHLYLDGSLE